MNTQPEATELAEVLEISSNHGIRREAAAKLRRLHEENAELRKANATFGQRQEWWNERMFALEQQRDALLKALRQARRCLAWACEQRPEFQAEYDAAEAAIKMVEEGK